MKKLFPILFLTFGFSILLQAQDHHERFESIDVQAYSFDLVLNDNDDRIEASAVVKIRFKKDLSRFQLDLAGVNEEGKGMTVSSLRDASGMAVPFQHENDKLTFVANASSGDVRSYTITYSGIPANGLIIAKNKYDDRTFFADNWPNRAHYWLPTVDHPSDKATVEWTITAPNHYQVVANGRLIEETDLDVDTRKTRWKNEVPIPTKVMVFGAARFAIEHVGDIYGTPVSSWVYPQNREEGFYDYEMAYGIMDWFINHVGPYPYAKLANVQSKTMFGGMENAGAIFYSENSVSGERRIEGLLAHEIAHQWFGNSASEASWHHSWLSEGFATYFTNLYTEQTHGRDRFVASLQGQRNNVIAYSKRAYVPLVNTAITDYMRVLSPNTYQKGGWLLHMLRHDVGDEQFWTVMRTYYDRFKNSNAYTADLQAVFEEISDRSFEQFFAQWAYQAGHPELQVTSTFSNGNLSISVEQLQENNFQFSLEIDLVFADGSSQRETLNVTEHSQSFEISAASNPNDIILDPDTWLLFEEASSEQ